MAVYVDSLMDHGWKLRGRATLNCHLFTDAVDLAELHAMAERIGMRRAWFQPARACPHYDLTPARRAAAVAAGALEVERRRAVAIWRARRAALAAEPMVGSRASGTGP